MEHIQCSEKYNKILFAGKCQYESTGIFLPQKTRYKMYIYSKEATAANVFVPKTKVFITNTQ